MGENLTSRAQRFALVAGREMDEKKAVYVGVGRDLRCPGGRRMIVGRAAVGLVDEHVGVLSQVGDAFGGGGVAGVGEDLVGGGVLNPEPHVGRVAVIDRRGPQ